jgi:beta-glucosidase
MRSIKTALLAVGILSALAQPVPALIQPALQDNGPDPKVVAQRVEQILSKMTQEEKIKMMSGTEDEMHVPGLARLGVPELKFSDGPVGVRVYGPATAYPCGAMLAATWDVNAARDVGTALGRDCRARGVHVLLGPGVNLYRVAQCGRNFEYFGEDPYLSSRLAVAWIKGVQGQGVATSVKHYAANDQEVERESIDTIVDERRLHEICFPPFKAAVEEANVSTVMAAYNKVNGQWCTANKYLLSDVLRDQWHFKGILMSDWGAVHEALGPLIAGTDLEMGKRVWYTAENINKLLNEGKLTQSQIDEHVRRILTTIVAMGFLDRNQEDKSIPLDDPGSAKMSLQVAREGLVLLKNDNQLLPLSRSGVQRIVVVGPNATPTVTGGGGSSYTEPFHSISLLDAITAAAGKNVQVTYFNNWLPVKANPNGKDYKPQAPAAELTAEQVQMLKDADAVVAAVGFNQFYESESYDRPFDLPADQIDMLKKISALSRHTIVVLNAGGNVGMEDWLPSVPALIHAWYPGQNGNQAVAEAIFGDINPGGKLPDTFEKRFEDSPAFGNYPGDLKNGPTVKYDEGIYVGYRWFDKKNLQPQFPFGYGLSYTTFAVKNMKAVAEHNACTVSADVTNTGKRAGDTVVQLYVHPHASSQEPGALDRPVQELKGFERVSLKPGETRAVVIALKPDAFSSYDPNKHAWTALPGEYQLTLGFSSRDEQCSQTIQFEH